MNTSPFDISEEYSANTFMSSYYAKCLIITDFGGFYIEFQYVQVMFCRKVR